MIVQLLSFNVQELNEKASIPLLWNYIQSLPQIDVILLQEHKLRNQDSENLGKRIWQQATAWSATASLGYGNDNLSPGANREGLITLVSPRLASRVSNTGSILGNRAQWTIFSGLPGGDTGIVNIYAPN